MFELIAIHLTASTGYNSTIPQDERRALPDGGPGERRHDRRRCWEQRGDRKPRRAPCPLTTMPSWSGRHNGLVAAAYLAGRGCASGAGGDARRWAARASTEETWPGYRVSTAAYVCSLLRAGRSPASSSSEAPRLRAPAAQPLVVHAAPRRPLAPAGAGSAGEPARGGALLGARRGAAAALRGDAGARGALPRAPMLDEHAARPVVGPSARPVAAGTAGVEVPAPGRGRPARAARAPHRRGPPHPGRAGSRPRRSGPPCATDAVIGTLAAPSTPGHGHVLFHRRSWASATVPAGSGATCGWHGRALGGAGGGGARQRARRCAPARRWPRIAVEDGRASGVVLRTATELRRPAGRLERGCAAHVPRPGRRDPAATAFRGGGAQHRPRRARSLKINVALSALPSFSARPGQRAGSAAPRHHPPAPDRRPPRAGLRRRQSTGSPSRPSPS